MAKFTNTTGIIVGIIIIAVIVTIWYNWENWVGDDVSTNNILTPTGGVFSRDGASLIPSARATCNPACLVPYPEGSQYSGSYYCNKNCSVGSIRTTSKISTTTNTCPSGTFKNPTTGQCMDWSKLPKTTPTRDNFNISTNRSASTSGVIAGVNGKYKVVCIGAEAGVCCFGIQVDDDGRPLSGGYTTAWQCSRQTEPINPTSPIGCPIGFTLNQDSGQCIPIPYLVSRRRRKKRVVTPEPPPVF